MRNVLVVGGAGYIGSHTCLALSQDGFAPVVYDNLSNGHREFVRFGPLVVGDLEDEELLVRTLEEHRPVAVVHFAALIEVGQSMADPLSFYRNNVAGTLSLLSACRRTGVDKIVFSSTCATYGEPQFLPMSESHPQEPVNPYGRSKLMVEEILRDLGTLQGLRSVALRYFNAAGADPEGRLGEWHEPETHVVPVALETLLGRRETFRIYGADYDTRDGTCIRDFIHVMDLADAHRRAVHYLLDGNESVALNLGTGTGTSVAELLAMIEEVAGRTIPVEKVERRAGDPPSLVADNAAARRVLGWEPRHDLRSIIGSAWKWHSETMASLQGKGIE